MDLRDVYVLDQDGGVYARPETTGEMPQEPQMYVAVPWRQEFLGDLSHNKDPWTKVRWTGTASGWWEERYSGLGGVYCDILTACLV